MTYKEAIKHFSVIRSAMKHCDELRDDIRDCIEDDPIELTRVAIEALKKAEEYKWHDLLKNPDDLPRENGWYEICHASEYTKGKLTHRSKKNYSSEVRHCEYNENGFRFGMICAWKKKTENPYASGELTSEGE